MTNDCLKNAAAITRDNPRSADTVPTCLEDREITSNLFHGHDVAREVGVDGDQMIRAHVTEIGDARSL